jgi:hypothetical protein
MENANSLYNRYSRYVGGGETERSNDFIEWWERSEFTLGDDDINYTVENFFAHRLDLIAEMFFHEPRLWWVIAQYNNILDPVGEISAGCILRIPSKNRLSTMLATREGGIKSKKQPITTISPVVI